MPSIGFLVSEIDDKVIVLMIKQVSCHVVSVKIAFGGSLSHRRRIQNKPTALLFTLIMSWTLYESRNCSPFCHNYDDICHLSAVPMKAEWFN